MEFVTSGGTILAVFTERSGAPFLPVQFSTGELE
jgi:hypothetical protein